MLRSSLGFHTITLSLWLFLNEASQLIADFRKYSQETGAIQIYSDEYQNVVIKFCQRDQGIKWLIRPDVYLEKCRTTVDIIDVTINPKILGGIHDYITAATIDDMNAAISAFDRLSQRISPLLRTFEDYSLKRIDYCINFALNELVPGCSPEQIMNLIKRSDIPPHYKEWMKYDGTAHRLKSRPSSFYLVCDSVNVNCYSKFMKFQEQSEENKARGYPPIPQKIMDNARDIIRFEVQCKYPKVYTLSKAVQANGDRKINKYESLLADEFCREIISYYFNATVGKGFWYSLHMAVALVKSNKFNAQKENRIIDALQVINQCRNLGSVYTS